MTGTNQKTYRLIYFILLFSPAILLAYLPSAQFLTLPYSARGTALGETEAAMPSLTATPYNPAALRVKGLQLNISYTRHFADANLYTVIIGKELGKFNVAGLTKTFVIPGIEKRKTPTDEPLMIFSSNHFQLGFASSYRSTSWLSFGANLSFIFEDIDYYQAQGYLYGLGFLATPSLFSFGGSVVNAGSIKEEGIKYKAPQTYNLMASVTLPIEIDGNSPIFLIAVSKPDYTNLRVKFGLTYSRSPLEFLLGYTTGEDSKALSLGLSLHLRKFEIGYSTIPYKNSLGWNHTISLELRMKD